MSDNRFGIWLKRQIRESPNVRNQSEFAAKIPTSTGTVSMWVTGKRIPDPASCDRIADALALDLDLVLFHAGHRPNLDVIDPDDPATAIISLAKRVDWSKGERFNWIEGTLRQWINVDHGENYKRKLERE